MARHNKIGETGENVATRFLMKHGFRIMDRNYRKKWGEIDIVAKKGGELHFIEVKSVSRETLEFVTHETSHRPEDNVHYRKRQRLARTIETYLLEKQGRSDSKWIFDVVVVYVSLKEKRTKINYIENIVL